MTVVNNYHTPFFRFIALFTATIFMLFSLTGCSSVSSEKEQQIAQLVKDKIPEFEKSAQAKITTLKGFSEIRNGVWKWRYEKGDKGKFLAQYGYFGKNPLWKTGLSLLVGGAILVVTLGYIVWFPWGINADAGLFYTVEVDLDLGTTKFVNAR